MAFNDNHIDDDYTWSDELPDNGGVVTWSVTDREIVEIALEHLYRDAPPEMKGKVISVLQKMYSYDVIREL